MSETLIPSESEIMSTSSEADEFPLVSIIIPAYNRSATILRAISSVQNQDWPNLEIIVIDDNSEDETVSIVEAVEDARIRVLKRLKNGGAAEARNDGVRAAKGKYVAFLDSDDYFLPGKIHTQVKAMQNKENTARISCTALDLELMDDGITIPKYHLYPADDFLFVYGTCDLSPGATLMVERSLFSEIGFLDTSLRRFEDWEWLIRASQTTSILRVNKKLSHVCNVRGRLTNEVYDSAKKFIELRRKKFSEIKNPYCKYSDLLIWKQVLGTAAREEKKWLIMMISFYQILLLSPLEFIRYFVFGIRNLKKGKSSQKTSQPSIAFIIYGLTGGGAERVIILLANAFSRRGWSVKLIHYQDENHQPFYEIDPQVDLVSLGFSKHHKSNRSWLFRKILYLRHSLRLRSYIKKEKVDVVVSFMDAVNVHSIFSMLFSSIPVIVCERNDPSYHHVSKLVDSFRRNLYPRAALVTTQTKKAANYFPDMIRARTFLVKNPVQISKFSHLIDNWSMSNKSILAIGRLERQKGFDILINAFAQLAKEHEDWTLTILGEGKEFDALQAQVDKLNLGDRIFIAGIVKDIRPHLEKASIFALSSRYEGFPNVLLEAMAAGRPIVATNCPSGVSELLNDGESGLLVSNEATEELAAGLTSLISDHGLAEKYRQNGIRTIQNYDESIVLDGWEQLVKHVIK